MGKRETYPNQRIAVIHRWNPGHGSKYTSGISGDKAMVNAIRRMNGNSSSGFVMWAILRENKDGHAECMSRERFMSEYGLKKSTYENGWKVLMTYGFLVHVDGDHGLKYHFHEFPEDHQIQKSENSVFKSTESGHLKVQNSDFQKSENSVFKSTESGRETGNTLLGTSNNYIPPISPKGGQRGEYIHNQFRERMKEAVLAGMVKEAAVWGLLADIQDSYPFFLEKRGGDHEMIFKIWFEVFSHEEITVDATHKAFLDYVKSKKASNPPMPGNIINIMKNSFYPWSDWVKDKQQDPEERPTDPEPEPEKKPELFIVIPEKPKEPEKTDEEYFEGIWKMCPNGDKEEALRTYKENISKGITYGSMSCWGFNNQYRNDFTDCVELLKNGKEFYEQVRKQREKAEKEERFKRLHERQA